MEIVILIDLKGGMLGNIVLMKLGSYLNLNVVFGLNLVMLIEVVFLLFMSLVFLVSYLEIVGRNVVEKLLLVEKIGEEEYEE